MSIQDKQSLTEKEIAILNGEMQKHKKSTSLAYVLWFFLGGLGLHKFYMGKPIGLLYIALDILGLNTIIGLFTGNVGSSTLGIVALVILGIMLLIDLFTIPSQLRKIYEQDENKVLKALTAK